MIMSAQDTEQDPVVVKLPTEPGEGNEASPQPASAAPEAESAALPAAQAWRATKLLAGGLLLVWLVAWPVGTMWAEAAATGTFSFRLGYSFDVLLLALTTASLILGAGFALSMGLRLEDSAERLRLAATEFAGGFGPRGTTVRREVSQLNDDIDTALERLARAESLIRAQVKAIDSAGVAIETGAVKSTERLEAERRALMNLTEEMNREAEAFAAKIAERTQASRTQQEDVHGRIMAAEEGLDGQIGRLEEVSSRSAERFETLASAMAERSDALKSTADQQNDAASKIEDNAAILARAQSELQDQSARLEALIRDQRRRADRLAKAITDQTSRLTRIAPKKAPEPKGRAWREILSNVEKSLHTDPAPARITDSGRKAGADDLIDAMQRFSLTIRTQLYGGPASDELARFEKGERMLFVRQLVAEEPEDLRQRVATEAGRNAVFDAAVRDFLSDFDTLLEPLSAGPDGDEAMAEYLKAPLGRLYVMVGTALGHFDRKD